MARGLKQLVRDVDIETYTPEVSDEDLIMLGRLAVESRLLREDVLVWMAENNSRRQEDAPMWSDAAKAWNRFRNAVNEVLDLEDDRKW